MMKTIFFILSAVCFLLCSIPAFAQTLSPQEEYKQCNAQLSNKQNGGIASTQKYASSITACLQNKIQIRLNKLLGKEKGLELSNQLADLQHSILNFYGMFTETNRYTDYGGNLALYANINGVNKYLKALFFRLSDTPADYSDNYKEYAEKNSDITSLCQKQTNLSQQQCIIQNIKQEIKKGFKTEDIKKGLNLFASIYEEDTKLYYNIYPHNPNKASAAVTEDLEYILQRLIFLNLTQEGY